MELRIIPVKNGKNDLVIEGASVIYKNFNGNEAKFNAKGDRNFGLAFNSPEDDSIIEQLNAMGWNVKAHEPKNPGDKPWYSVKVKVRYHDDERYKHLDPSATLILGKKQTALTEETIGSLDNLTFLTADVRVSMNPYEMRDGSIIQTLYLKQIYVTGEEDYLSTKYNNYAIDDECPFDV